VLALAHDPKAGLLQGTDGILVVDAGDSRHGRSLRRSDASWMFWIASSSVEPCDQQPGNPGTDTLKPSSVSRSAILYFIGNPPDRFYRPSGVLADDFRVSAGAWADSWQSGACSPNAGDDPQGPDRAKRRRALSGRSACSTPVLVRPSSACARSSEDPYDRVDNPVAGVEGQSGDFGNHQLLAGGEELARPGVAVSAEGPDPKLAGSSVRPADRRRGYW
jgi:hypothetical protein